MKVPKKILNDIVVQRNNTYILQAEIILDRYSRALWLRFANENAPVHLVSLWQIFSLLQYSSYMIILQDIIKQHLHTKESIYYITTHTYHDPIFRYIVSHIKALYQLPLQWTTFSSTIRAWNEIQWRDLSLRDIVLPTGVLFSVFHGWYICSIRGSV